MLGEVKLLLIVWSGMKDHLEAVTQCMLIFQQMHWINSAKCLQMLRLGKLTNSDTKLQTFTAGPPTP